MFDFFKDAYAELNGLDMDKVREEKKKNRKKEGLFSKPVRRVITVVGILYLILAGLNIYNIVLAGFEFRIIKYFYLIIIDLFVLVTIQIRNKDAEKFALIGLLLFMGSSFLLTNI